MADAGSARKREEEEKEEEDDVVCLDPSFFVDRSVLDMTSMDALLLKEAEKHGMHVEEVDVTRTIISNLEGVIFDIILK